jgi:hypothetical protein
MLISEERKPHLKVEIKHTNASNHSPCTQEQHIYYLFLALYFFTDSIHIPHQTYVCLNKSIAGLSVQALAFCFNAVRCWLGPANIVYARFWNMACKFEKSILADTCLIISIEWALVREKNLPLVPPTNTATKLGKEVDMLAFEALTAFRATIFAQWL